MSDKEIRDNKLGEIMFKSLYDAGFRRYDKTIEELQDLNIQYQSECVKYNQFHRDNLFTRLKKAFKGEL